MRVSVRGVIIEDGKVLAMFRRKVSPEKTKEYYVVPGGGQEGNETLLETLKRELMEEMSIEVEVIGYLGKDVYGESTSHFFHCKKVGGEIKLSGPELETISEENYYEPRFVEIDELNNIDFICKEFVFKALNEEYENLDNN